MGAIAKFIIQIIALLAAISVVAVSGCWVIFQLVSWPTPVLLGWLSFCLVTFLFCADLLTLPGAEL